jgi:hypothetical protein
VLKLKLDPHFASRALGAIKSLPALLLRMPRGLDKATAGVFAGWCAVVLVGAVLMSHVAHENRDAVAAPAMAAAAAPKAPVVAAAPKLQTLAVEDPAPAPAVAPKSTQRVDMTPTASIAADASAKPKHKPHKKKAKDLDSHP